VDRAIARAESGDLKGAREDYDRAIAAFGANLRQPGVASLLAALLTDRGVLRLAQRDLDGALADFDRAVALAPENPGVYVNRGLLQLERGARTAALVDLRRALALTRDASEAKALRARIATLEAEGAFGREP
jgi:tetratricopeptide (TPR) repeat protein